MPDRELRAFKGDYDTIAAYDLDDVRKWYVEDMGSIDANEFNPDEWKELAAEEELTLVWERRDWEDFILKPEGAQEDWDTDRDNVEVTATVGAWVEANGRGMLCSTEY